MSEHVRPNGKVYRPRKTPAVMQFADLDGDFGGVAVLRTHDVDEARRLAAAVLDEYEMTDQAPETLWWREAMREGEHRWVDDAERGIPVVVWEYDFYAAYSRSRGGGDHA